MKPLLLRMQAFGSYVEEQVLDFEKALADAPFVLIHGVTGAGKTTILDAIVFALYGESSGDVREGPMLRSASAPAERVTEVEYTFALGRRRYRVYRSPAYERISSRGNHTRRAASGQLYRLPDVGETGEEVLLDSGVTEVSKRISQLIGFDADQFRQVVLLPQGQFERFLLAEVKDRSAIMQRIFRTERYQRLEDALDREALALAREADEDRAQMDRLLRAEEAASPQELRARIVQMEKEEEAHAARLNVLEQRLRTARQAREAGQAARIKLQEVQEAEKRIARVREQEEDMRALRVRFENAQRALPACYKEREAIRLAEQAAQKTAAREHAAKKYAAAKEKFRLAQEALRHAEAREPERLKCAERIQMLLGYTEQAKQLRACMKALAETKVYVQQADEKRGAAEASEHILTEEIEALQTRIFELEKICAGKKAVMQEQERLSRVLKTAEQINALMSNLPRLQTAESASQAAAERAANALLVERDKLKRMQLHYHLGSASRLAQTLTDGAPCPVCGSLTHPVPAMHDEDIPSDAQLEHCADAVEKAELELQKLRQQAADAKFKYEGSQRECAEKKEMLEELLGQDTLSAFEKRVAEQREHLLHAEKEYNVSLPLLEQKKSKMLLVQKERKDQENAMQRAHDLLRMREGEKASLEKQIPEECRDINRLEREISKLQQFAEHQKNLYQEAQQNEKLASTFLASAETAHAADVRSAVEALQQSKEAQNAFRAAREEAGFASEQDYRESIAGKWSDAAYLASEGDRIKRYDTERKTAEALLQKAQAAVKGLSAPDMPSLLSAEREADENVRNCMKEQGSRMTRLKALQRIMKEIDTMLRTGEKRDARYRIVGKLAHVAAAKSPYQTHFQTYVLRSILSDVIEAANQRLVMMSRGRYRLIHGEGRHKNKWWGLEIDVFDEYTGIARLSRTLSGGETFLASLALALGLSDVVQHYAGGMHLDMIFIDEGFGSLDSETLDVAMRALLDVQQESGRLVGIISHVEELRTRIPVHLEVLRSGNGSRAYFA